MLALTISLTVNTLALYGTINVVKRYNISKQSAMIERTVRKAYISRKKYIVASSQVRKIRGSIFKLSMFQFIIPFTFYIIALVLYALITAILFGNYVDVIKINSVCIAPIPIAFPAGGACSLSVVWIHFLVFLLYLPLYDYYAKRYLGQY
ncbi:MAG: hypothetical protein QW632_01040 [Ignisphaera sp.]